VCEWDRLKYLLKGFVQRTVLSCDLVKCDVLVSHHNCLTRSTDKVKPSDSLMTKSAHAKLLAAEATVHLTGVRGCLAPSRRCEARDFLRFSSQIC